MQGKGPKRFQPKPKSDKPSRSEEWIESLVERGATLSFVAGIVATILPAPFALIAMKNISELDISDAQAFGLIVMFNLLMFILVELPLVGFARRARLGAAHGHRIQRLARPEPAARRGLRPGDRRCDRARPRSRGGVHLASHRRHVRGEIRARRSSSISCGR